MARTYPPTLPLTNFEANARRVRSLICEVHPAMAGQARKLQSDIAAAAVVMTISAVDTYFGDRFAEDFEQRFDHFGDDCFSSVMLPIFQTGSGDFDGAKVARAFRHDSPRAEIVRMFREHVDASTYQSPVRIAGELAGIGVKNVWKSADVLWKAKYTKAVRSESQFWQWAELRHSIAHRSGRARTTEPNRRALEHVSHDEARDCLNFFTRLLGLVDFQVNQTLYGRQPRRRQTEVAVFDLERVSSRVTFVPARQRKPRVTQRREAAPSHRSTTAAWVFQDAAAAVAVAAQMAALPDRPRTLAPGLPVIMPDRLAVWPTEQGFGLDVTWRGIDGLRAAESVKAAIDTAGVASKLVQGMGRDWTVRVGPGTATEVRSVIDLFLPAA